MRGGAKYSMWYVGGNVAWFLHALLGIHWEWEKTAKRSPDARSATAKGDPGASVDRAGGMSRCGGRADRTIQDRSLRMQLHSNTARSKQKTETKPNYETVMSTAPIIGRGMNEWEEKLKEKEKAKGLALYPHHGGKACERKK